MSKTLDENDGMILVRRREWLRLTALAGAAAVAPAVVAQQLLGNNRDCPKGCPNRLAALWLAITTGQNWDANTDVFTWDSGFVTTLPKDTNPKVADVFAQVKSIVEGKHATFSSVCSSWNNLVDNQLFYSHPDTRSGIMALANTRTKSNK